MKAEAKAVGFRELVQLLLSPVVCIDDFDQDIEQLLRSYDRMAQRKFEENHAREKEKEKEKAEKRITSHWTYQWLPARLQVSQRMAQAAFTIRATPGSGEPHETTARWFMFDDVWAASHPDLAKSLLWFAKKEMLLF